MQPEFISVISIPASFKKPPSMPISPNSFSISTTCSPFHASFKSFWINVVFPAPRKPEITSIFVIFYASKTKTYPFIKRAVSKKYAYTALPQHFLNFLPLPQGHGSFGYTFGAS